MSEEHRRRIKKTIAETLAQIVREMTYSPRFRKEEDLKFYREHLTKLEAMLAQEAPLATPLWKRLMTGGEC